MTSANVSCFGAEGKSPLPETIGINLQEPRVGVIAYYAALAYPQLDQLPKRRALQEALIATWVKTFAGPLGRKSVPSLYTGFKNEKIHGAMRLASRRIAKRLSAGLVGWNLVLRGAYEAETPDGKVELFIPGAPTVQTAIRAYIKSMGKPAEFGDEEAVKNATHRVWAESLPVLHLAMANPITLKILGALLNGEKVSAPICIDQPLFESIYDPNWLRDSLQQAEELRASLERLLETDPTDVLGRGFRAAIAIRLIPLG